MTLYYIICFFILGTIFGSFYNVVGSRMPEGESIMFPPSHCNNCNHKLSPLELIPIFSYIFQGGKCKNCKVKLSIKYLLYEVMTGILFAISYYIFGISLDLIIALTFVSILNIVIISDIDYFIIEDKVLIFGAILIFIELLLIYGVKVAFMHLLSALISFIIMLLIKLSGDRIFKKESMGGGDIKLLSFMGLVIGVPMSIITIFLSSFIALPISIFILFKNKTNIIPYGPFLSIAAIIIFFTKLDFYMFLDLLR